MIDQMEKQMFFKTKIWKIPISWRGNEIIQQRICVIQMGLNLLKGVVQILNESKTSILHRIKEWLGL